VQSAAQLAADTSKGSITFYASDLDYRAQQWQQAKSMMALLLIVLAACIAAHALVLFVAWQFADWQGRRRLLVAAPLPRLVRTLVSALVPRACLGPTGPLLS
jgi:hypothetical protein